MKSERTTLKYLLAALAATATLPILAIAQPVQDEAVPHCEMPRHPGHHGMPDDKFMDGPMPPFLHGLNLTEAQRDAVFKIVYEQMPAMRDRMKQLRKSEEALHTLTSSNQYDDAKAKALAESVADDSAVLSLMRAQGEHKIFALLTPEQRKQVDELKANFGFHNASGKEGKSLEKSKTM